MKKVKKNKGDYFFSLLTKKEQREFKNEFKRDYSELDHIPIHEYLDQEHQNLKHFIAGAFFWFKTIKGRLYWENIADSKRSPLGSNKNKGITHRRKK